MKVDFRVQPDRPWMVECKFPYNEALVNRMKKIPGREWDVQKRVNVLPLEMVQQVFGLDTERRVGTQGSNPKLHPYQKDGLRRALAAPLTRWVFNDEMGLGKTAQAIEVLRLKGCQEILVVTPAIVRDAWLREFDKWWPDHPEVGIIFAGMDRKGLSKKKQAELAAAYRAPIKVISFNLLAAIPMIRNNNTFDGIVLDECHMLQSVSSTWAQAARHVVDRNPEAAVLGLTATWMPNQPLDLYNIVDIIWPGRFGKPSVKGTRPSWNYCQTYTNARHNGYGWEFKGVAEDKADELAYRVGSFSSRATRAEQSHLIPKMAVRLLPIDGVSHINAAVKQWATLASAETSHWLILTHLKQTARDLGELLGVEVLTGDVPASRRDTRLQAIQQMDAAGFSATMHCIGRGIDLGWCNRVLFVELDWRPEAVEQMLGRFPRLSSKNPTSVDILMPRGSHMERVAAHLVDKLESMEQVVRPGQAAMDLQDALGVNQYESLTDAVAAYVQDDWDNLDLED